MIFALILSSLCPGTPTHHASGHSSGFNSASPRPRWATLHLFPITTIIPFSYLDNRRYASSLSWNLNIDCQEIDHFYSLSPVPSPTKLAQPMAQVENTFKHYEMKASSWTNTFWLVKHSLTGKMCVIFSRLFMTSSLRTPLSWASRRETWSTSRRSSTKTGSREPSRQELVCNVDGSCFHPLHLSG